MILHGDCVEEMRKLDEASVDAIVCDPPYGLEFMGKEWDALGAHAEARVRRAAEVTPGGANSASAGLYLAAGVNGFGKNGPAMQEWHHTWATEALRVLKPGGHLVAAGGTRTFHRLVSAIEDAGFEIRDTIAHMYGSGFPKSHNGDWGGTALKPSFEPWTLARKPLVGTVEQNWREHGTGALNVDATRIGSDEAWKGDERPYDGANGYGPADEDGWSGNWSKRSESHTAGRWPSNCVLSHLPECVEVGVRKVNEHGD